MNRENKSISTDFLSANIEIQFKDEPLEYKEVIATCASIQVQNHVDSLSLIPFKTEELDINDTNILNVSKLEKVDVKEECDTLPVFAEVACNSFCDDVRIDCENIAMQDPLSIDANNEKITILRTDVSSKNEVLNECDVCKKQFPYNFLLKQHIRIHSKRGLFKCEICGKKFNRDSNLKLHKDIHLPSIEKLYKCDVCFKEFNHEADLKQHEKAHSEEKQFTCDLCHKQFTRGYHLNMHKKSHLPVRERPYKCLVCSKDLFTASDLRKHKHRRRRML